MTTTVQRSFAGGEIAPALYARVDTVKYQTGLRTMRNFFVMRHGGAANRPGTQFIGEVKDSSKAVKLVPFIFNAEQTYVLEFGDQYLRVIRDGVQQTLTAQNISGISNANPGVLTYAGSDTYAAGDHVYISGVVGDIAANINGRTLRVGTVDTGANTFTLLNLDGTNFNTTSLGSYTSGGTIAEVYTVTTPYLEADLPELQFIQSADVVTLVHPKYAPRELSRTGHTSWTLSTITFAPEISAPTNIQATQNGVTGSSEYSWTVTAVNTETGEESLAGTADTITDGNATLSVTNPVTITWTAATGASEYNIYREVYNSGVFGFVGTATGTTFLDEGIEPDSTDTPPSARNPFDLESSKAISGITQANPAVVTTATHGYSTGDVVFITGVTGMTEVNDIYFIVTVLSSTTFSLATLAGDAVDSSGYTAYSADGTAQRAHNYPSAVTYYQQRLTFANTNNDPEKVWASKSGQFKNFTVSSPLQDDDAVTFTMAGRQVNEVRHMIDLGKLLILTSGGEHSAEGDAGGVLKPGEVNPKQYSYNGSSTLPPIVIGSNALYVQARGSIVRDLGFKFQSDGYDGDDLTIFSAHLVDGYTLSDWAYQQIPHSIVWAVRSDGTLIGLTYVREQQMLGWHRHDFDGDVENVCVVPEDNEDALYLVINRTIDGATKRYIERMYTRRIDDIVDAVFMDCALTYDGRNTTVSHTMTLSGGTDWDYLETLTLTSSTSYFTSAEVGNSIHLYILDDDGEISDTLRCEITEYTSATVVSVRAHKTVPVALRSAATDDWARAVDQVTGLWHLEGQEVSVFADGFVVANPNNDAYTGVTVSSGTITLDDTYAVIHVGLPITADLETLDIDAAQGETLADKKKQITRVTLFVESSRGIWVGARAVSGDAIDTDELTEVKVRNSENYDEPVALQTGTVEVNIKPEWNSNGRVFIRQSDPIPLAVLAVAPSGLVPFRG